MKLKRYHIDIFCPEWTRDSILEYISLFKDKKLKYSYHALKKLDRMKDKYRRIIRGLIRNINFSDELYLDYVFEFYTDNQNIVRKLCYRFPMVNLDTDVIIITSITGKIVTIYLNDNFDKHHSLDVSKYEQGEK